MRTLRSALHRASEDSGATLVEFAFTLPLLLALLYAIFDFGGALTLKQKLGASIYEAARTAASQSTGDLSNAGVGSTGSVADIRDSVAQHLQAAGVNDCGLLGATPLPSGFTSFHWVYNVSTGCPAPLILTIDRQLVVPVVSGGVTYHVIYTHVRLEYPFQWRLAQVIQFLVPGGTFPSSGTISAEATMQNLT